MRRLFIFTSIFILSIPLVWAQASMPAQTPVVVELFSSEVCGFCPPADAFLGKLAGQDGIIALSCHVDYFRGEHSVLAKRFCTDRQKRYVSRMKNVKGNYTPQMVVNGHIDAIGYQVNKVNAAILKARSEKIGAIQTRLKSSNNYDMILPNLKGGRSIDLILVSFRVPQTIAMTRGPNLGKRVTYTNVIHSMHNIGAWDGSAQLRYLKTSAASNIAGFAILAQERGTGRIVAAGSVKR